VQHQQQLQQQQQQQQQQRQRHLQESCLAFNDSWLNPRRTFVVSHHLRLIYCFVGKTAGTSWIRVLLQLTGNPAAQHLASADRDGVHTMFQHYLEPRSFENATQFARSPYKDYYKFMFVREPLERLVSAYRDKIFREEKYASLRQFIIGRFRQHSSPR